MSTSSSGCLVSCSASVASHGARILRVFLLSWLNTPIFGGSIMGTSYFLSTKSSLVHLVFFVNSLLLWMLYFYITSRFHKEFYVSRVFPLYRKGMKLLRQASLDFINVMALYASFFIKFHNCCQLAPFCHNRHFSNFLFF
jgi:hypothetical protein